MFDGTSLFNKVYNYVPHRPQYKIFRIIKVLMTLPGVYLPQTANAMIVEIIGEEILRREEGS